MTVLVTGAAGFLGSAVARRLVQAGRRVRAMVRRGSDRRSLEGLDVDMVVGDLTDPASLKRALQGCDGLFHVAADYRLWVPDPKPMFAVNVHGTRDLMLAALGAGVGRVVFTSTVATLGIAPDGPADEQTPVRYEDMVGAYARSKFRAERAVRDLIRDRGLPAVIVNPSTVIGPRDSRPTPTGRLVLEAAAGRIPVYIETGLNVVHVDDVADGHLRAYERGRIGERYILGGEDMTLSELLAEIADISGRRRPRIRLPHGAVEPLAGVFEAWCRKFGGEPYATVDGVRLARRNLYFSSAKACRELDYATRLPHAALADAIAWFRAKRMLR